MQGYIVVITRNGSLGGRYPLTSTECLFGQSPMCDVRVYVQNVARKHCVITALPNNPAYLSNLSPLNTTLVNGSPIGSSQWQLGHRDIITVGDRHFQWEYPVSSRLALPKMDVPKNNSIKLKDWRSPLKDWRSPLKDWRSPLKDCTNVAIGKSGGGGNQTSPSKTLPAKASGTLVQNKRFEDAEENKLITLLAEDLNKFHLSTPGKANKFTSVGHEFIVNKYTLGFSSNYSSHNDSYNSSVSSVNNESLSQSIVKNLDIVRNEEAPESSPLAHEVESKENSLSSPMVLASSTAEILNNSHFIQEGVPSIDHEHSLATSVSEEISLPPHYFEGPFMQGTAINSPEFHSNESKIGVVRSSVGDKLTSDSNCVIESLETLVVCGGDSNSDEIIGAVREKRLDPVMLQTDVHLSAEDINSTVNISNPVTNIEENIRQEIEGCMKSFEKIVDEESVFLNAEKLDGSKLMMNVDGYELVFQDLELTFVPNNSQNVLSWLSHVSGRDDKGEARTHSSSGISPSNGASCIKSNSSKSFSSHSFPGEQKKKPSELTNVNSSSNDYVSQLVSDVIKNIETTKASLKSVNLSSSPDRGVHLKLYLQDQESQLRDLRYQKSTLANEIIEQQLLSNNTQQKQHVPLPPKLGKKDAEDISPIAVRGEPVAGPSSAHPEFISSTPAIHQNQLRDLRYQQSTLANEIIEQQCELGINRFFFESNIQQIMQQAIDHPPPMDAPVLKQTLVCTVCNKSYSNLSNLKRHKTTVAHRNLLKQTLVCTVCNKSYSNRSNLKRHQDSVGHAFTHTTRSGCLHRFCVWCRNEASSGVSHNFPLVVKSAAVCDT